MMSEIHKSKEFNELVESGYLITAMKWIGEQIPGGFFIYHADDEMKMIFVNDAVLRIFGCKDLEEFKAHTGYTFKGMVHPDDFKVIQASINEQIADKKNNDNDYVEYRIVRKDGSIRWVDDYGHFAKLPGYGDVYYVFIGDITEKHNAEEEKIRKTKIYLGILDQFNSSIDDSLSVIRSNLTKGVVEDVKGKDLYETDFVGAKVTDCIKSRLDSFISEDDRTKYIQTFELEKLKDRFFQGQASTSFVGYCRRASGRHCFVKFTSAVAIDPNTGDTIVLGTEKEYNAGKITEFLNEKVLIKQYDMVTYIIGDNYGVAIGDASRIKYGSIFPRKHDGKYMDYIMNQVIPAASEDVHDKQALAKSLSLGNVAEQLRHNDSYTVDVTVKTEDGVFNKRFTFYVVDEAENIYLLLKSDVTDVLRIERERNDILGEALKEAEHANVVKTAFLSNMSHEIRTPMNAIIGLDSLALKEQNLPDQTRDYLVKIGNSARHLLGIINDVLDMSRIESGRLVLRKEEFSFSGMLEQINTMIQSQCNDKGLSFECHITGQVDDYYIGDDMKLKQVLINILSNAIKFTDAPGSITFSVEKVARYENQSTLRFVVKDTGIGMSEDFIPRIFDAFSQENTNRNTRFGSTGLGMAITKNIVEMMNGTIAVKSIKGKGSEFTVTLTLKNSDHVQNQNDDLDSISVNEMKVLVVDDDPIACEHAKMVLDEVGIAADTCQSGDEAYRLIELQHTKSIPYNLILVDWKMPGQDGIEVTRRIRESYNDDATIVILTSYNWDDVIDDAIGAGVDSFMAKPLFANSVIDEFKRIAKRKNMTSVQASHRASLEGRRILLAEDIMINAEIMKQLLGMRGIEVEYAENGRVAFELFRDSPEFHFDAILMDVRMPEMDGLEATAMIKSLDREDAAIVPVIALTANAFDEDVKRSLQVGMKAHLSKPVEPDHLFRTLESLIYEAERERGL